MGFLTMSPIGFAFDLYIWVCVFVFAYLHYVVYYFFAYLFLPGEFDHESYWGAGPVFAACDGGAFTVSSDGGEVFLNHYRSSLSP